MEKKIYRTVIIGCLFFIALTLLAMIVYPGGQANGKMSQGYDFFRNFFSDLGRTRLVNGAPNTLSLILFFIGLILAGGGLIAFFVIFRKFFAHQDRLNRILSGFGSLCGIATGICFIGVAFTPYDLLLAPHKEFVMWAFRFFLVGVALYAWAIFRQREYPRRNGWIFVAFTVFLAAYLILLTYGPGFDTDQGLILQATGQKIIVYVSILCVIAQSQQAITAME